MFKAIILKTVDTFLKLVKKLQAADWPDPGPGGIEFWMRIPDCEGLVRVGLGQALQVSFPKVAGVSSLKRSL